MDLETDDFYKTLKNVCEQRAVDVHTSLSKYFRYADFHELSDMAARKHKVKTIVEAMETLFKDKVVIEELILNICPSTPMPNHIKEKIGWKGFQLEITVIFK